MQSQFQDVKESLRPLEIRTYKYKSPVLEFFCPLCRTSRAFTSGFRLKPLHYFQISLVSGLLMYIFYPLMEERVVLLIFLVWLFFEWVPRASFRRKIPCPHCGFDAVWYKRDIKVAQKKVEEFWKTGSDMNENLDVPRK